MNEEEKTKTLFYIYATMSCNLSCIHCYVPSSPNIKIRNELTTEELFKIIDFASKKMVKEIRLTGGEPLLRKDIIDVINYALSKGLRVSIETNGLLISEEFLQSLKYLSRVYFGVSLDGPKEVHEKIRGKGTFDKTVNAILLLKKYNVGTTIITSIADPSWVFDDRLTKFTDLLLNLSPKIWYVHAWVGGEGRGRLLNIDIYTVYNVIKTIYDLKIKMKGKLRIVLNVPLGTIPKEFTKELLKDNDIIVGCNYWNIVGFSSTGDVSICHRFTKYPKMRAGNIRVQDLEEILKSKILGKLDRKVEGVCSKCILFDYCQGFCPADIYAYYGDLNHSHPLCQLFYENGLFNEYLIKNEEQTTTK